MLRSAQYDTSGINIRQSTIDNRQSRRGSVLVLVMTLLGILFVLGVAFLASMNFEADMIVSESKRDRAESSVTAVVDQLGSLLRDGLMSDSHVPFGDPSTALSATAYAEMPGVQNSFSSVEPNWHPGPDGVWGGGDVLLFSGYADMIGLRRRPYAGPSLPQGFAIDTSVPNGASINELPTGVSIRTCATGPDKGNPCDLSADCAGFAACEGPRVLDADGDGIVDSIMVDASLLDFANAQLAALSARLNPASNPTGKVFVGMRVIPHGGLVNLNASHPKLIENVLDVPDLRVPANPADYGDFKHRPTLFQVAYSPLLEEPSLRRRGLLAPRTMPPSWLYGDPLLNPATFPSGKADMQWQLFPPVHPGGLASSRFETVFNHRYWAFNPSVDPADPNAEWYKPGLPDLGTLWAVRMEPFTADAADGTTDGIMPEYDRRHLVTTVSHDDLLARGGRAPNTAVPGGEEDILTTMARINQTAADDPECPPLAEDGVRAFRFEYVDYPWTIPDDCCPTDAGCRLNARKGRLQLSLPYLDDQIEAANKLTDPALKKEELYRIFRLIHDTFFLLVRNAANVTTLEGTPCDRKSDPKVSCPFAGGICGTNNVCVVLTKPTFTQCTTAADCSIPGSVCRTDLHPPNGVCTVQAPYWQDVPCTTTPTVCNTAAGEECNTTLDRCVDARTRQTHSQALISRTAAALTANLIDYADLDDIPTRIAQRSFDFTRGVCTKGTAGFVCDKDTDCGLGGLCAPPAKAAGKPFDFDATAVESFHYVYGLELQPYITEVATYADQTGTDPPVLRAWAVELFNPYDLAIDPADPNTQYVLIEVKPDGSRNEIALVGRLEPNPKPFSTFVTAPNNTIRDALVGPASNGNVYALPAPLPGAKPLTFGPNWTLYLIRRVVYPGDSTKVPPYTDIVVDQFEVKGDKIANPGVCTPGPPPNDCITTLERVVKKPNQWPTPVLPATVWTATMPKRYPREGSTSLGDWNPLPDKTLFPDYQYLHPVEVNFANLGSFSRPFNSPTGPNDPRNGSVSFPTTGSLLMLMRHANRSLKDYTPPGGGNPVTQLAFTTALVGVTNTVDSSPAAFAIHEEEQIDNGRMPVFDIGQRSTNDQRFYSAHHLSASTTQLGAPGNLDMLPWGQLVFDYFTALPLSNPGPYVDVDPGPDVVVALPDSQPRVDLDGLRVHGRININAAPWKVLAGLPFVPMKRVPTLTRCEVDPCPVSFRDRIRSVLPGDPGDLNNPPKPYAQLFADDQAGTIGEPLAQAIVAYRELHPVGGSGDYANGTPKVTPPGVGSAAIAYARGWNATPPAAPMARRGTGFMTVGELANVRHYGATATPQPPPPLPPVLPKSLYRIDGGVIDILDANNNTENFVDAVAGLVALGDWVTVRSQVFTVYGVLRGEEDQGIKNSGLPTASIDAARDVDSRALRFQETIDRLPTFLGEPVPSRIGARSLTRYTDVRND